MTIPGWLAPLFFLGAILFQVFALIAAAGSGTCLGTNWNVWTSATLLALFAFVVTGGYPRPRNRVGNTVGTPQ